MATTSAVRVSDEARLYGLQELCRRAGMREEHWDRWRIEAHGPGVVLRRREGSGRVVFPAAQGALRSEPAVRKAWMTRASGARPNDVRDFVVPYCTAESKNDEPLFIQTAPGEFCCTVDLAASAVLVLSRFEEIGAVRRDEHGRFRSADSVAARDGYLDRPIVDEWGLALEEVIAAMEPGFRAERRLRVKVSHDVDLIGIPFGMREAAVQMVARRRPAVALRDLLSGFTGVVPGSLRQVIEICAEVQARGLKPALYWKASRQTPLDSGYDIADPRVAQVMRWAREYGVEQGVHPGYDTFNNPQELSAEVERCRQAVRERAIGGRQHYLRWSPETWLHWEQCGLAYDSTVGYTDRVGFRAGTCLPYRPWLWNENRRAELLEIPLIVMDQTLVSKAYMGLSPAVSVAVVRDLLRKCANVGGVFTLSWRNNCLGQPFAAHWPGVFDALAGMENYDWREEVSTLNRVGTPKRVGGQ